MAKLKRWKAMDNVFIVSLVLLVFFAWMDVKQITSFFVINTEQGWSLYNMYTGPAIWSMWAIVVLVIGIIWYIAFKDRSEAVALTVSLLILQSFGTQDLFYFLFSDQTLASVNCWADVIMPVRVLSDLFGQSCPTGEVFLLSGVLGAVIVYFLYPKLQKAKW